MRIFWLCVVFILALDFESSESSKILALFPSPSRSQIVVMEVLTKELAERGHQVTMVSPFPLKKPMKNYRDVKVDLVDIHEKIILKFMNNSGKKMSMLLNFPNVVRTTTRASNETFNVPEFQRIMKEESFDLVIVGYIINHFLLGLGDHFKCPTIVLATAGGLNIVSNLNGNPIDVAAVPHLMSPYQGTMNFPQRLKTFLIYSVDYLTAKYMDHVNEKYYLSNFPPDKYKTFDEVKRNVSLTLICDHFSQGSVKPLLPNTIDVGGLQVKSKPSPLPERIQTWLDGAKHGAIFFSLGSNAKSTFMPKEKVEVLMKVFGKLKQRVIFKWETDSLPGQPDNVLTGKWLPQDDILAHKNMKLFISHGGLGSVIESKFHNIPIIAMPLWGDQMSNAEKIVEEGWAVRLDYATLNEEALMKTIKEVLENPKYRERVKYLSDLFKDRPATPLETATFWVEYVLRHRGAPHMHYPGADLNFFQRNSIDVIVFLSLVIYLVFKLIALSLKCVKCIILRLFQKAVGRTVDKTKKIN